MVDTQYGPVQVEVSVSGGKITRAHTLQHPTGGRSDHINSYAVPQLNQETMTAQNANIDTVSGATFTSGGYRQSLQSALDAAHQAGAL
ncbi:FMN-binding protein [Kribbella sp. GL6]|uniref:FMN-binding protein n=1 Tax=Kribbella sp. GL6 TaxID=3419765 RepID=UPI003D0874A0